jgi:hypothetical protein
VVALLVVVILRVNSIQERLSGGWSERSGRAYSPPIPTEYGSEEEYVAAVSERNLFLSTRIADEGEVVREDLSREAAKRELDRIKAEYEWVGVSWRDPLFVILAHRRKARTYLVCRVGETVGDSDVVVKSISRHRVVLGLQDEVLVLSDNLDKRS